jgi:hypothetical protein
MFQTSELGYSTVGKAREAGASAHSDVGELIRSGVFPNSKVTSQVATS